MNTTPLTRIGIGYDIHRLVRNRPLIIGGVHIDHHLGAFGHSDADVLLHALCDALLGSLSLGDIGTHFPDTDPQYHNINSMRLLEQVQEQVCQHKHHILHIDSVIHLEKPKLLPYIASMRQNIASALDIALGAVSIKATTHEQLGAIGQEQGVAAQVIALVGASA